jgi:hypothetical protein
MTGGGVYKKRDRESADRPGPRIVITVQFFEVLNEART